MKRQNLTTNCRQCETC